MRLKTAVGVLLVFLVVAGVELLSPSKDTDVAVDRASGKSDCQRRDLRTIRSKYAREAVVRAVNCPGWLAQGTFYYVVFVHGVGERNSEEAIALQYEPGYLSNDVQAHLSPPPTVRWNGEEALTIDVTGVLERIVKQRENVNGVVIQYRLGSVSSGESARN